MGQTNGRSPHGVDVLFSPSSFLSQPEHISRVPHRAIPLNLHLPLASLSTIPSKNQPAIPHAAHLPAPQHTAPSRSHVLYLEAPDSFTLPHPSPPLPTSPALVDPQYASSRTACSPTLSTGLAFSSSLLYPLFSLAMPRLAPLMPPPHLHLPAPRLPIERSPVDIFLRHLAICHSARRLMLVQNQSIAMSQPDCYQWFAAVAAVSRRSTDAPALGLLPASSFAPGKTSLSWATVNHTAVGANGPMLPLLLCSGWSSADCAPDLSPIAPFFSLGMAREFLCDIPDYLQPDDSSSSNAKRAPGFLCAAWIFVFHAPDNVTLALRLGQSVSDMSGPYEHTAHLLPTARSR